jgi:hypothetical protein
MLGRDVLKSAVSLLTAAAGPLLPRRRAPGGPVSAPGAATAQERLLRFLLTGGAPGTVLSVAVGGGPAAPAVRCRFARGSDLDACAFWVRAKVSAWVQRESDRTCGVEVNREAFAPVVEARCRVE